MKTSSLITAGVVVGALVLIAKSKQGLGDADMLLPPTGRTVTASGQVLGGLGALFRGRPSPGAGRKTSWASINSGSIKAKAAAAADAAAQAKAKDDADRLRIEAIAQQKVNDTLLAIQKKADDDMAAQQKPQTNFNQAKQAYDAMAAAREQASMSQASSDAGYGQTSNDTGYGATQQVTEEGAPKLPEQISQVQTPSAQMLPQQAPAAAPTGNSKVGLLVGGGVLAAIAAAMAS